MKMRMFCLYVCLFLFCVFSFGSGSGGVAPTLIFTSWQAGRGVTGGPSNAPNKPEIWYTFTSNSETQCQLNVTVGYAMNQPANAYKINSYKFKVKGTISLPGLSDTEMKDHKFTFPEQDQQQVAPDTTTFNYASTGTLTSHWAPTGGKEEQRKYCSNYSGNKKPQKGRKLSIDVTFIGYYGTDPIDQQSKEIKLRTLDQDPVDHVRQEYIDQGIYVPSYSDFKDHDQDYNHGHYDKLMDGGLKKYHKAWLAKCNEMHRKCNQSYHCTHKKNGKIVCSPGNCFVASCDHQNIDDFVLADFTLASGYRNPHHNRYHVKLSPKHPHGLHQYGVALDIETPDVDGDGTAEQVFGSSSKSPDGIAMEEAATAAGADWPRSWEGYNSITHADWRNDYKLSWPPKNNSSVQVSLIQQQITPNPSPPTPPPSTDTYGGNSGGGSDNNQVVVDNSPNCDSCTTGGCSSCPITYACGVHSGDGSAASSHTLQASCLETDSHGQGCTVTNFYACQTHTHQYLALISGACGHTYTSSNSYNHRSETCPTNSNGDSCTSGSYFACQSHTHVYPPPAVIICARVPCEDVVGSAREHWVTCSAGHEHWTCHAWHFDHHRVRTCRRSGCGQSWQRCMHPVNDRTPDCLASSGNKCAAIQ